MIQPQEPAPPSPFRLGEWEVRRNEGLLCAGERLVRLEPRVMDVLVHLAANPDRVVSKEELLTEVWGGAFVEEGALAQAIHSLRKALGDDARQPRFIQTVPKRGYRLVAGVEPVRGLAEEEIVETYSVLAPEVSPQPSIARPWRAPLFQVVAVIAVILVLWMIWVERGSAKQAEQEANGGIRIIVLPFKSLGEPEDPSFAAGLTEEITANLTLIPTMLVIPGRNALGDKGVAKPLSEIREELKVDYVLMGTVDWRVRGGQVRVRPQLVRMTDETIVFGDPFEVSRGNLFKAQQEISRAVIATLDITLTPEQSRKVGERSSKDSVAYRMYFHGLVLKDQPYYSPIHLQEAARLFQQAVKRDPAFAEAWAELSQVYSYLAFNTERTTEQKQQARDAMERAIALRPDLLASRLAQAYFSYRCLDDYGLALAQATAAAQVAPNSPKVLELRGLLLRRLGRLPEAIDVLKRASALNPRTAALVWTIAETYRAVRDHEQADTYFGKAIALAPDVPFNYEQRALNRLSWTGNTREARSILQNSPVAGSPQLEFVAFHLDLDERKYRQALARLSSLSLHELPMADQSRLNTFAAIAHDRIGDHGGALALAGTNMSDLRMRTEKYPRNPIYRAYLAVALAQLGRREEALDEAAYAVRQGRYDAFSAPRLIEIQSIVDVILGRRREAITRLAGLLSTSYRAAICTSELKLEPMWDPLRRDQDFVELIERFDKKNGKLHNLIYGREKWHSRPLRLRILQLVFPKMEKIS